MDEEGAQETKRELQRNRGREERKSLTLFSSRPGSNSHTSTSLKVNVMLMWPILRGWSLFSDLCCAPHLCIKTVYRGWTSIYPSLDLKSQCHNPKNIKAVKLSNLKVLASNVILYQCKTMYCKESFSQSVNLPY